MDIWKSAKYFLNIGKYLFPPLLSPSPDHRCVATCAAIAHRGSGSSLAKCEIVSFSIKAWQEDCLKLSKREYIFKPGMQFVLSARRTLTGLPDIGSYKVSQPPTTNLQHNPTLNIVESTSINKSLNHDHNPTLTQPSTSINTKEWLLISHLLAFVVFL